MNKLEEYLNRLPDVFLKITDSNLGKFLQIFVDEISQIEKAKDNVEEISSLENAYGKSLDLHGANVGQLRGRAHDELYKLLIRSKIQSNLSGGDVNSIIDYIVTLLQINRDDIEIIEPDWSAISYEPASFEVRVTAGVLSNLLVAIDQFTSVLNRLAAAGVRPYLSGKGTFALADEPQFDEQGNYIPVIDEDDSDGLGGFSDENQEIGGTLGAVYQPPDEAEPLV
ncbi:hypothetical protein GM661_00590 [Iocasia frigidifontis]|uniref:Uncharacterized protein n=1 Tax=Iocasia fonsfrigidae TaxID=2682810 RepID=A0A8A7K5I3_9FIRM|nr:hypothetical protein [Iocasia fonsfrigidae]QTL96571.1 hypothetical protein GM661_00590 [Iocasia fonsfrigidae]